MARGATLPPAKISEALSLLNADFLAPLMDLLAIARPRPTRKADMVKAALAECPVGRWVRLCLLFEYAATLGLVDVAYTDLRAGERLLVVRTKSEKAFRKAARALGYGVAPA